MKVEGLRRSLFGSVSAIVDDLRSDKRARISFSGLNTQGL